jgi:2-polyprenyl-3-methyl-5-hydroxy-6-metoxy-1,4-benzoquinol methylase
MKASDLQVIERPWHSGAAEPIDFTDGKVRYVAERCRGKRVLDLGCVMHDPRASNSRYFLHRAIAEVAREAVGLDLHEAGVANLNAMGYTAQVGDAERFAFDQPFDVIVAGDLVEHLGNLEGFFTSVRGALAPGGVLIVQSPNPWYWRFLIKAVLGKEVLVNQEHTCWFCLRTFRQLAARHGMELGAAEFSCRALLDRLMPLPAGWKYTTWSAELRVKA